MLRQTGSMLSIDLGAQAVTTVPIERALERYVGGRGLATKLAHERIPFDVDPFGPANRVYLATGPLQASQMSFTGRMSATTVSPLTDGLLSSNAGGFLSRHFTAAGYPCVEIHGTSDTPLAVHVSDEGVRFEAVPELAGARVSAVSAAMAERHDLESAQLATVGPAGERRVRYASLMTSDSRAFGRGGIGAVLGAKGLKTISFGGDRTVTVEGLDEETATAIHREAATSDHMMKRQGTTSGVATKNALFSLPTAYFERMEFDEGVDGIDGAAVESKKVGRGTCSVCAFACKLPTEDEATGTQTEGPEFETIFAFGSTLLVDDIVHVMQSNELCDELGLDTISAGVTIGAYLQAEGRLGEREVIHELLEQIAAREGPGDLLAEGVGRIHEELDVVDWTSKGLEFPGHDGRVLHGRALGYATANRGADHMYSKMHNLEYDGELPTEGFEGKPAILVELENLKALNDSAVICKFSRSFMTDERYERLFGVDYERLLAIGARVVTLERHFNNQRGLDRADDSLPFSLEGFDAALDRYYDHRGWRADGVVPEDRLPGATEPAD